ncbi:transglutaminase domain-containing protein [bacterium]|nr:transglutaminase domain-containing protein [bacterium]
MKKFLKLTIFALVALWWAGSMFVLWKTTRAAQPKVPDSVDVLKVGKLVKQHWASIYFRGDKIGYTSLSIQQTNKKLLVNDITYMRLPVGGTEQEIYAQSIATINPDFSLESFNFELSGGDYITTASGKIEGETLTVIVNTAERTDTLVFPIKGKIYPPSMVPYIVAAKGFEPGKQITIPGYDPFTLQSIAQNVTVVGKKRKHVLGKDYQLWHLKLEVMGLMTEMFVTDSGDVMIERSNMGFEIYREPQEKALAFELSKAGKFDMLKGFAIPARWRCTVTPRKSRYAKFVLIGFKKEILEINDFNQKLFGDTLVVCADGFTPGNKPSPEDTAEQTFIQCHDRRIATAARKITKGESDTLGMLIKINDYLYRNMEKQYQTSIPSAVDILRKMKGDCNEHSTLFVALARALGIPARINVGLMYYAGSFGYHAWVQAYANGRWHTFDPTLGQHPADAAHIKLLSGNLEKQVQLLRLGQVGIDVLECKENCND